MKKVLFWLLIIFVVIPTTIGIIMAIVTPNKTSTPTTTTQQTTKTTTKNQSSVSVPSSDSTVKELPDLELIGGMKETHDEIIDNRHYIVGSIKNNTSHKYNYVQITFILLDKDKNQIGTAMDNVNYLEPGRTWKFKALVYDDSDFAYFKLGDISGW